MSGRGRVVGVAQAFKESLDLPAVALAMERGTRAAGYDPIIIGASDGGDGLIEALSGDLVRRTVHHVTGPAGSGLQVEVGWLSGATAVVESRLVCGLSLLGRSDRDPRYTTTRGVGELVSELEAQGVANVLMGLGGSATMDGGTGMARAWGWEFMDGAGLAALVDPESGLQLAQRPGTGAAGGLGFGLMAFAGAALVPGAVWMLERRRFDVLLAGAAAVLVGEGQFDATSLGGKLTGEALARAAAAGVPGVLVAPTVTAVPPGRVVVETGDVPWDAPDLERHVRGALARLSRS